MNASAVAETRLRRSQRETPPPTSSEAQLSVRYMPSLDGLRAVAVIAVLLYHLPVSWLPGGFLGVDVFFVLSGFLITSLLLEEALGNAGTGGGGGIGLKAFWGRRARRLLPAAWATIVLTTLAAGLFARDALAQLRGDVPASLGYVLNWHLIFHHEPYSQAFGRPPLLLHLWSLAIEEQFYLVWPLVLLGVLWWAHRRAGRHVTGAVAAVALGGAVVSGVCMAVFAHRGQDPSAVYFNPGTHASGLLLGAALAAGLPIWRRRQAITSSAKTLLDAVGIAAALGLVALFATLQQQNAASYEGGMQLAVLLTAVVLLVASHPGARLGGPLAAGVLVWVGRRSYSMYLWHWPIFELTRPGVDWHLPGPLATMIRLAMVVVAADVSYRWIETPWRTGRAQRAVGQWWRDSARPALAAGVTSAVVMGVAVVAVLFGSPPAGFNPELAAGSTPASHLEPNEVSIATPVVVPIGGWHFGRASQGAHPSLPPPVAAPTQTATVTATAPAPAAAGPPPPPAGPALALGDSVMLGATTELEQALGPGVVVDATVGRQVKQGLARLAQYKAAGHLAGLSAVVIGLGSNGPITTAQCQQFEAIAAGVPRVVFVNVRVPRSWQNVSNASLAACTAGKPGVVLANWYEASAAPGVLGPDRVHETPAGRQLYASVVATAVRG